MTDNRIKQIAFTNGFETICNKTYEELAELITALAKYQAENNVRYDSIVDDIAAHNEVRFSLIEEIADVEIMVEQLKLFLYLGEAVKDGKEVKVERQCERMGIK